MPTKGIMFMRSLNEAISSIILFKKYIKGVKIKLPLSTSQSHIGGIEV
jgi:hypothetical protein